MSEPSPHRTPGQTLAWAAAIVLVIAALTTAGYVAFVRVPADLGHATKEGALDASNRGYDLARRIVTDLADALQLRPTVMVGNTTVVVQTASVAELATVERSFSHTFYWENRWAGSTKLIELKGDFVAKAGYDLSQPFTIAISRDGTSIEATMPHSRILSVEQTREYVLQDADGLWNKLTPQDRENAKNELLRQAREALESTDILEAADAKFMERLEEIVRRQSPQPITLRHTPPLP
jgi:hypothetical protein